MANLLTALSGSCSSPTTLWFLFIARRWPGPGPDSSQHLKLLSNVCFFFLVLKEFQLYGGFRSDNLEKSDRKSILS